MHSISNISILIYVSQYPTEKIHFNISILNTNHLVTIRQIKHQCQHEWLTSSNEHARCRVDPGQSFHPSGRAGQLEDHDDGERDGVNEPHPGQEVGHQQVIQGQGVPGQRDDEVLLARVVFLVRLWGQLMPLTLTSWGWGRRESYMLDNLYSKKSIYLLFSTHAKSNREKKHVYASL